MALCRSAQLAPVRQSARRLGARSRGSTAEAPDALIRRLGREILHHVPVATRVSELGQEVGVVVHLCALALQAMHRESLIPDPVQMHLITSEHDLWRKSLRDCPFPEPW